MATLTAAAPGWPSLPGPSLWVSMALHLGTALLVLSWLPARPLANPLRPPQPIRVELVQPEPPMTAPRPIVTPAPPPPVRQRTERRPVAQPRVERAVAPATPAPAPDPAAAAPPPMQAAPLLTAPAQDTTPAPLAPSSPAPVARINPPAQVTTTGPVFDAAYLNNPRPGYPAIARRLGITGRVLLEVMVSATGSPEKVALRDTSGNEQLDQAALDAVRGWRFVPARRGDTPVVATVLVPIRFELER